MIYRITHYGDAFQTTPYPVPLTAWREGNTLFTTDGRAVAGLVNNQWVTLATMPLLPSMHTTLTAEPVL